MSIAPGSKLGPYEVLSPLGAGGMGEVYKAKDTRLDRSVAIKVLPAEFARDPSRRTRLDREAKAISQFDHPHICALYDVGAHDGVGRRSTSSPFPVPAPDISSRRTGERSPSGRATAVSSSTGRTPP